MQKPPNYAITMTKLRGCEKVKIFLPGIWCMGRMGDPLDTYKSENGDLKVPHLASATGIRPEMNISALSLHGVGMSPGGQTGALSTAPGSEALLILLLGCFHSTQHTLISWPYGVWLKTMGSGYLDSNRKLFPSWLCQGVWDSVYSSVK